MRKFQQLEKKAKYTFAALFLVLLVLQSCGLLDRNKSNVVDDGYLYIPTGAPYEQVMDSLRPYLKNEESFDQWAQLKDYPNLIKAGKYKLIKGESNAELVNKLRAGLQEEVATRIPNSPTLFHLAASLADQLEPDSAAFVQALVNHRVGEREAKDPEIIKTFILPDTYNFYWNNPADKVVDRLFKTYEEYWTPEKESLASAQGLNRLKVMSLASIVQKESPKSDEHPRIAGAYLNRLNKGIKLQADPTVQYANKLISGFDIDMYRVLNKHTLVDSPYNTYRYAGLPPAPICLPNRSAIEAVLNPEEHDYIFFCADPDRPGYHSFATNYQDHLKNAQKYWDWLNKKEKAEADN